MNIEHFAPLLELILTGEAIPPAVGAKLKRWLEAILVREDLLQSHIRWLQRQDTSLNGGVPEEALRQVVESGVGELDPETCQRLLLQPVALYRLHDRISERMDGELDSKLPQVWVEVAVRLGEERSKREGLEPPEFKLPFEAPPD